MQTSNQLNYKVKDPNSLKIEFQKSCWAGLSFQLKMLQVALPGNWDAEQIKQIIYTQHYRSFYLQQV